MLDRALRQTADKLSHQPSLVRHSLACGIRFANAHSDCKSYALSLASAAAIRPLRLDAVQRLRRGRNPLDNCSATQGAKSLASGLVGSHKLQSLYVAYAIREPTSQDPLPTQYRPGINGRHRFILST